MATGLRRHKEAIIAANKKDLEAGKKDLEAGKIEKALLKRLELNESKLEELAKGIETVASLPEPIGQLQAKKELADGLCLDKVTVPIGVLLVVFESRPDSLPQIAALSIRSGNGLLLKGGKEAKHSNAILHRVIVDALFEATGERVSKAVVGLVESLEEVGELLGSVIHRFLFNRAV